MRIEPGNLDDARVQALLAEHLASMHALSPPEEVFALDTSALRAADISFWTAWEADTLLGCGALRQLSASHGEVKSMRTPHALRGRGAGRAILMYIIAEAHRRGYHRLSLETGRHADFRPAQHLYASAGFVPCGPFGDYQENGNSVFMTLELGAPP